MPFIFFANCKKKLDPGIDITLGSYEKDSRDKVNRAVVIEDISQSISYSKDSNVILVYFFSNISGNESFDYLKEGLIDYIINISRIRQVEFVDTSTLWSKLKLKDIANPESLSLASVLRIAKELNVKYLVTGNYRVYENEIDISASLRRTEDGFILSESKQEGEFSKLFEIMNNLTEELFANIEDLDDIIPDQETLNDTMIDTDDPEAYNHYLQGIYYHKNFKINEALSEFQKAVDLDRNFGSAYIRLIGLSPPGRIRDDNIKRAVNNKLHFNKINQLLLEFLILDKKIEKEKAFELANKIDSFNREIRDADLSFILFTNFYMSHMDINQQIEYLENIIHQNPFYEQAYNYLGYLFAAINDFDNAIKYLNQYSVLLPDSPNPHDSLGDIYRMLNRTDLAEQEYKIALKIDKAFFYSYQNLLAIYEMEYRHHEAVEFTEKFFRRFIDDTPKSVERLISLSTAYLLFSHQSLECLDYRNLSVYIIYLLRNGFIDDAVDLIDKWYIEIRSKGDLTKIISDYPYEFIFYFGQPVLMKFYLTDSYEHYIGFLEKLRPLLDDRRFIELNNFISIYFNDNDWLYSAMDYFDLKEKAIKVLDQDINNLKELFYSNEFEKAKSIYENLDRYEMAEPSTLMLFAMQIDIKTGDKSRVEFYERQITRFKNHYVHYNIFTGMLEELKGNHDKSLQIYNKLLEYLKKNNRSGYRDIGSEIIELRIMNLEN